MLTVRENAFVDPYPQEALDGALGLTSSDIAAALGVAHNHLMRDLKRRQSLKWFRDAGFQIEPFRPKSGNRGRKGTLYAFETEAAKAIVAQSKTQKGIGYLRYLISCERKAEAAEVIIPLLLEKVSLLEKLVNVLSKPKKLRGPGRRHRIVAGFQTIRDLWGNDGQMPVYRDLAFSEMTDEERRAYEAQHLSKIASGASKKAAKLINHEVAPGKRSSMALVPASSSYE